MVGLLPTPSFSVYTKSWVIIFFGDLGQSRWQAGFSQTFYILFESSPV